MENCDRVYSIVQTAKLLKTGENRVRALVKTGDLKSIKESTRRLISSSDIKEFLDKFGPLGHYYTNGPRFGL